MKNYADLILFGKVVSTALLVVGYILLGYYLGRRLVDNGYPSWTHPALMLVGAIVGTHQMYFVIRELIHKINK
ncbi:MAG: hypothetical protein EOM12_14415 [Verrucomicrobiae bacterium]|nr:hypothetical protein [Verrucomicrobiae bacterium]